MELLESDVFSSRMSDVFLDMELSESDVARHGAFGVRCPNPMDVEPSESDADLDDEEMSESLRDFLSEVGCMSTTSRNVFRTTSLSPLLGL